MAEQVIARQQGDDFQARFFWYKACNLYTTNTTAFNIAWEMSEVPGFDDVVISYKPARLENSTGNYIASECYQVKFHVDHARAFTCDALIDPEFIGSKKESVLQRLQRNYVKDKKSFSESLYILVNTWGIDYTDPIGNILDNNGAIKLNRLFDGTTDASKMGAIRAKWRSHLKLSGVGELKTIVAQLRIVHNLGGLEKLTEDLNIRLQYSGFQPLAATQRTCPYTSLIQTLHAQNKKVFTAGELRKIAEEEKLLLAKEAKEDKPHSIGIRSFRRGTETLTFETDSHLCLLHHFQGRFVLNDDLWEKEINQSLKTFAQQTIARNKPVEIHLDTHQSVAFAFGYLLDTKCGIATTVVQKTKHGRILFACDPASDDYQSNIKNKNWAVEEVVLDRESSDIVIALNVTHNILDDVFDYVVENVPSANRIISATIMEKPSGMSIRNGNHIALAVDEIVAELRTRKISGTQNAKVHLFMAAPNAMIFALGQNFKSFGKLRLYEFDFEKTRNGSYYLSLELSL